MLHINSSEMTETLQMFPLSAITLLHLQNKVDSPNPCVSKTKTALLRVTNSGLPVQTKIQLIQNSLLEFLAIQRPRVSYLMYHQSAASVFYPTLGVLSYSGSKLSLKQIGSRSTVHKLYCISFSRQHSYRRPMTRDTVPLIP